MGATDFSSIAVIGAGAWGAALAHLVARNGLPTRLWAREADVVQSIRSSGENARYLPGFRLHPTVRATNDLADAGDADGFVFVAPVQHARAVLNQLRPHVREREPSILLCSKGLEQETHLFLTEVLSEVWPDARASVLSGPSFAKDVVAGMPTAVTLASGHEDDARRWARAIGAAHFRPYFTHDLIGVQLGGAVKNVIAIAAGVVDGRGLGESARAALIARGFAEFQRLGIALGARRETMAGLSGLGDLILTACSRQSRNMSVGAALGSGTPLAAILSSKDSVAEGVATAKAVVALAKNCGVETPICAAVADLVSGARTVDAVIADLLARPFRDENE